MTLVKIGKRGNGIGINIPRPYLRQLGWTVGEHVKLELVEDQLTVQILRNIGRKLVRPGDRDSGGVSESV